MTDTDKPLEFVGSSKDDLSDFPLEVKRSVGFCASSGTERWQAS